jgi:hypothetical protein
MNHPSENQPGVETCDGCGLQFNQDDRMLNDDDLCGLCAQAKLDNYDPTPYCAGCGATSRKTCRCDGLRQAVYAAAQRANNAPFGANLLQPQKPLLLTRRFRSIAYPASYRGDSRFQVWCDLIKGRAVRTGLSTWSTDLLAMSQQQQNAYGMQQAALANQQNRSALFGGAGFGGAFGGIFGGGRQ